MNFRLRFVPMFAVILATASYAQNPERISRELPNDVVVHRDIGYASYGERDLYLDLYMPADNDIPRTPVVVVVRGGGWMQGDKEGYGPMAAALAKRGIAAASIEYRASGEALFPSAVEDTKAAVRWLRANAEKYNFEADAIGAIGGSAGAHLALYLGVTSDIPDLEGDGGHPTYPSSVSAVVGLATPGNFVGRSDAETPIAFLGTTYEEAPELWRTASPITHIDASSPPLLLMHSESDKVVTFEQSVQLANAYGRVGVPVELVLIPDAPHDFWNFTGWFEDTMDRTADFFNRHLKVI